MDKAQKLINLYRVVSDADPEEFNIVLPWSCVKGQACHDRALMREGLREDNFISFFELTTREFGDLYYPSRYDSKYGGAAKREALLKIKEIGDSIVLVIQKPKPWWNLV